MKKPLSVCLMIMVALNLFFPLAYVEATSVPLEDFYENTIERALTIVPDITIYQVGTLKVTISWSTPSLTFDKRQRTNPSPTVSYYALKENKEVVFSVANESIKSTDTDGFNGNIKVTPSYSWPTSDQAKNVTMAVTTNTGTSTEILHGTTNEEIKLTYSINSGFSGTPLSLSLSKEDIARIMTANITFKIEKQ